MSTEYIIEGGAFVRRVETEIRQFELLQRMSAQHTQITDINNFLDDLKLGLDSIKAAVQANPTTFTGLQVKEMLGLTEAAGVGSNIETGIATMSTKWQGAKTSYQQLIAVLNTMV